MYQDRLCKGQMEKEEEITETWSLFASFCHLFMYLLKCPSLLHLIDQDWCPNCLYTQEG